MEIVGKGWIAARLMHIRGGVKDSSDKLECLVSTSQDELCNND